jgi:DNA repair/transcription protein MET18/MMS19
LCLPVYGSGTAETNSKKLWNCLRLEIFQPVDVETEEGALLATRALVETIYEGQDVQIDDITGFAKTITQECLDVLKQPEKSQAQHAIKTICVLLSTTRK